MKRWLDFFRTLIAFLLVLQVGTVQALPSDGHLNLCLGYDGHFEISADACHALSDLPSRPAHPFLADDEHHGECLDLPLGCSVSAGLLPSSANLQQLRRQSPDRNSSLTRAGYLSAPARQLFHLLHHTPSTPADRRFPPAHLTPLRTIVLLI